MKHLISFILGLFLLISGNAWAESLYVTGTGAGAADGSSLANAWNNSVTFGTGAGQFGRGDTLYVCGTEASPVTVTITPSGVGAFDGTVSATSDILEISGEAAQCGGSQGVLDAASSHAINASGIAAFYAHHLTIKNTPGSGVQQLLSSSVSCAANSGFYCGKINNIYCENVASSSGHCVSIAPSGNTNFPSSDIPALLIDSVSSVNSGGAACRIAMKAAGAKISNCASDSDGSVQNTWGVYQSGVALNCGAANSGAGVTWTNVSGTVFKTTQTSCGASTGATIADVYSSVTATGVPGDLAYEAGCVTNDGTCAAALDSGEWGQITDTVYINRGASTPTSTAAVYLTYGFNTNPIITTSTGKNFSSAFDGVGIGCDFGTTGCVISRSYASDNPGYNFACGAGAINCTIRSSIGDTGGTAAVRMGGGGGLVENFSSDGNATIVSGRTHTGETLTVRNVGGDDVTDIAADDLSDGTLTETTNSLSNPIYIGGTNPTTANGFIPRINSPLLCAGTYLGRYNDYGGGVVTRPGCVDIGAWQTSQRIRQ